MIGFLAGEVRHGVIMTAGGVGYEVHANVPLVDGSTVGLWCVTVTSRDGQVSLYGFDSCEARQLFQTLRKVQGVGPGTALGICQLGVGTVTTAIRNRDVSTLATVKGVSTKTAERICAGVSTSDLPTVDSADVDVALVDTLVNLGYPRDRALDALASTSGEDRAHRLRDAISRLAS